MICLTFRQKIVQCHITAKAYQLCTLATQSFTERWLEILRSLRAASISRSTEPLASSSNQQPRGGNRRPAFGRIIIRSKQLKIQVELCRPSTDSVAKVEVSEEIKEDVNALIRTLETIAIEKPKLEKEGLFEEIEALERVHHEILVQITEQLYAFALPFTGNGWTASRIIFPDLAK